MIPAVPSLHYSRFCHKGVVDTEVQGDEIPASSLQLLQKLGIEVRETGLGQRLGAFVVKEVAAAG